MKTFVRIENARVAEVLCADELPDMHPSLMWVEVTGCNPKPAEGWTYRAGGFQPPAPPPLDAVQGMALAHIVTAATRARDAWRTPGKDGVYLSKQAEAAAWWAAGRPTDLSGYPYLSAEVGITRPTAAELVNLWQAMAAAWAMASAQIEGKEQAAKAAVKSAGTVEEIEAVLASLEWPKP